MNESDDAAGRAAQDLVVAADLGGTNLRTALVDRNGEILFRVKHRTPRDDRTESIVRSLIAAVGECVAFAGDAGRIRGLTVAIPGTVHYQKGTIMNAPNLPWMDGFNLSAALREELRFPIAIENDANAAAVGESWRGAAREVRTMLCVTLGTGVGGGVILNDQLWRGIDGTAGEIGHMGVEREGPPCTCGSRGCIEVYASATAVVRQVRELAPRYPNSPWANSDGLTAEQVYEFGTSGDHLAREVFRRAGLYLGMGLASLVNVLNPEMIVIGGGVAAGWDLFIDPVRGQIEARAFPEPAHRVQVVRAECGDDAGLLGAAYLAFDAA